MCYYLLSRVLEGMARKAHKAQLAPSAPGGGSFFPYVSVICWGIVMYLFESDKQVLIPSLQSSMTFLYKDSDKTEGWRDFVPFYIP